MKRLLSKIFFGTKKTSVNQFPYDIEIIAENLDVPWALDISDSGTIYVTERTGVIRIIENGRLLLQPLIKLGSPFVSRGRLRDVIQAKDGSIYISTSNMDGRGSLSNGGDKIIRLIPKNQ